MPPRFAYWTIILDGQPTAFRAAKREELLPALKQLQGKNPGAELKWFARGKLWNTPEEARSRVDRPLGARGRVGDSGDDGGTQERRDRGWRPGGEHRDPREKFKKETFQARKRREKKAAALARQQAGGAGAPWKRPPAPLGEGGQRGPSSGAAQRKPWQRDRDRREPAGAAGERKPWQGGRDRSPKPWASPKPDARSPKPPSKPWQRDRDQRGPAGATGERKPWQRDRDQRGPVGAAGERKPWQRERDQRGPVGAAGERKPWQRDRDQRGPAGAAGERKPWQHDRNRSSKPPSKPWQRDRDQRGPVGAAGERRPWQGDRDRSPKPWASPKPGARSPKPPSKPWRRDERGARAEHEVEPRKRVEKPVNPTPEVPDQRPVSPEPRRPQDPDRPPRPSEDPQPFTPGDPERIRTIPDPPERATAGRGGYGSRAGQRPAGRQGFGAASQPSREAPSEPEDTSGGPAPAHKTKLPRLRKK